MENKIQPAGMPTTADVAYNLELYANGKEINPNILRSAAEIVSKVDKGELVEVVHGKWLESVVSVRDGYDYSHIPTYKCPICGHGEEYKHPSYCPNCGTKMDGERKDGGDHVE